MDPTQRDANRANWNERAEIHVRSRFYDLDGFVAGRCALHPSEPEELGDVRGKTLVHLQCHLGNETLSWARRGARVVGLDFSSRAVEAGRALAARAAIADASFVEADVHDAVRALGDLAPFDVVYVSVGAINWLPSIRRWAAVVSALLRPGGVLYMREVHPTLFATLEREGRLEVVGPYFESAGPLRAESATTYTDADHAIANVVSYEWAHGLGEIIGALLDEGLTLELLHEHRFAEWQAFPRMERGADRMYRLPEGERDVLPLTFSLRARRR